MSNAADYASLLESINHVLYTMADRNHWFVKRFMNLTPDWPVISYKHDWLNRPLVGFKDTLNTAINNSATTIIVNSGTSTSPKRYIPNQSIIDINDEQILVGTVSVGSTTTTLTGCTRGVNGTTAAAQVANAQVLIISAPPDEGADASRDDSQKGYRIENYTQIFQRVIQLSRTAQRVKTAGNEASMDLQAADMIDEIMKEMQFSALHGQQYIDATKKTRRMGGLKWFATTYGSNLDNGGNPLNASLIEKSIESYLVNGGDPNKMLMLLSVKQQRQLNNLKIARVVGGGQTQSETNLNNFVSRYDFGNQAQVEVQFTTDLRDDELYFMQNDRFEIKPLNGEQFNRLPLAKTGDADKELVISEFTCEYRNPKETLIRYKNMALPN